MTRAFFAPLEQSVYPIPIPFKQGFDSTISSIFHPSEDAKPIGSLFGLHPKKHTLHPALDDGVSSDFIFHGYPPNASRGIGQNLAHKAKIKMNVEHRTSNVEHRIMMSLRSAI
jgi:hypothetical protein